MLYVLAECKSDHVTPLIKTFSVSTFVPGWSSNSFLWLQALHTVQPVRPLTSSSSSWPLWSRILLSLRAPRAWGGHFLSPLHLQARSSLQLSAPVLSVTRELMHHLLQKAASLILFIWVQCLWWGLTRHGPPLSLHPTHFYCICPYSS